MSIGIYWKIHYQKRKVSDKNSDIFHISAQNIECDYSSEPPRLKKKQKKKKNKKKKKQEKKTKKKKKKSTRRLYCNIKNENPVMKACCGFS